MTSQTLIQTQENEILDAHLASRVAREVPKELARLVREKERCVLASKQFAQDLIDEDEERKRVALLERGEASDRRVDLTVHLEMVESRLNLCTERVALQQSFFVTTLVDRACPVGKAANKVQLVRNRSLFAQKRARELPQHYSGAPGLQCEGDVTREELDALDIVLRKHGAPNEIDDLKCADCLAISPKYRRTKKRPRSMAQSRGGVSTRALAAQNNASPAHTVRERVLFVEADPSAILEVARGVRAEQAVEGLIEDVEVPAPGIADPCHHLANVRDERARPHPRVQAVHAGREDVDASAR